MARTSIVIERGKEGGKEGKVERYDIHEEISEFRSLEERKKKKKKKLAREEWKRKPGGLQYLRSFRCWLTELSKFKIDEF